MKNSQQLSMLIRKNDMYNIFYSVYLITIYVCIRKYENIKIFRVMLILLEYSLYKDWQILRLLIDELFYLIFSSLLLLDLLLYELITDIFLIRSVFRYSLFFSTNLLHLFLPLLPQDNLYIFFYLIGQVLLYLHFDFLIFLIYPLFVYVIQAI